MKFLKDIFGKSEVKECCKQTLSEDKIGKAESARSDAVKEPSYMELALRTENKDFQGIAKRLDENSLEVMTALNNAILAAQQLDYVVKKTCYYGKPPKMYDAPLFPLVLNDEQKKILHSEYFVRYIHGFMGGITENAEGLEALAKHMSGEMLDKYNLAEEIGDCEWYASIIIDESGRTFESVQKTNIMKLAKRYGEKFSDFLSVNRDLDAERKILEGK